MSQLQAASLDITPSPAPRRTIRVNTNAPTVSSVTAVRTASGFTLSITGYASPRDLTQAIFAFTARAGGTLDTTTLTIPIDTPFASWYTSATSAPSAVNSP